MIETEVDLLERKSLKLVSKVKDLEQSVKVKNHAGGYVHKISDLDRLKRYIIIGSDDGTFYIMKEKLDRQNIECLDRIIAAGDGLKAVSLIEDVSVNRRNVKQSCLLKALAVCTRCNDRKTKKAAYSILSKVCRIPTFLFEFVKFCQEESLSEQGKGWGRAHKKAITEWYRSFKAYPELLARHISKFKKREGWTHKDVLRLAHSKIEDSDEIGFILRYIIKGHDQAKDFYMPEDRMDPIPPSLLKVSDLLAAFDRAMLCREEGELISLTREYKLTWEQCPTQFLKSAEVWKSLLPQMPIEAMIKNLGRMTALGVFPANSREEEMACKKIRSINKMSGMQPHSEDMETEDDPTDIQMGSADDDNEDDVILKVIKKRIGSNFYHPFKVLVGLVTYKAGRGEKGKLTWMPNQRIVDALDEAFYKAFEYVEPTNKNYYLAIDVSGSMSQPVLGSSSITCATAAAAMTMMTMRTEENTVVKGFSHEMKDIGITDDDKLHDVLQKVDQIMMGATDCSLPMKDAMEKRLRDIDVFVVYTDNETWYGNVHPTEALRQYRMWSDRKDAKLAVVGMCATEFSIADSSDPNMLDIVGFDSAAPRVLSMFASGQFGGGEKKEF